jgi:hypothetical protein
VTTPEAAWIAEPEISPIAVDDDGTVAVAIETKSTNTVLRREHIELEPGADAERERCAAP